MLDNERIFEEILDLCGNLEIEELQSLIANIQTMIENKEEEVNCETEIKTWEGKTYVQLTLGLESEVE